MRGALNTDSSVLFAQVKKANSDHKIESESNLLRSKNFHSGKPVYLGNVANCLIAQLSQPDTPFFSQPPSFNEQVWHLTCKSSSLSISIESIAYWGFGLFNSGYLNRIEISGPLQERARVFFDLVAALSHNPWEFRHRRNAQKTMQKEMTSLQSNEKSWRHLLQVAKDTLLEQIAFMAQRTTIVEKKLQSNNGDEEKQQVAKTSLHSALHDLDVARAACADDNSPAVERALARVEASLITAEANMQLSTESEAESGIQASGHILQFGEPDDDENVDLVDLSQSEDENTDLTADDAVIVDLSINNEEE